MKVHWSYVPIPEPIVLALAAGFLLHFVAPSSLLPSSGVLLLVGAMLLVTGLGIGAWSVGAAGNIRLGRPSSLVTHGPYGFSRNPMYLSWTMLAGGLAFILNSFWIAIAGVAAWIFLHAVTIPREESSLLQNFGTDYESYQKRVRRWL